MSSEQVGPPVIRRKPKSVGKLQNRIVDRETFAETMGRLAGMRAVAVRVRDAAAVLIEKPADDPRTLKRTQSRDGGYRRLQESRGDD